MHRMTKFAGVGVMSLLVAGLAVAADTQTIDLGGLTFQAPAAWKKVQPKQAMRKAQMAVPPAAGDTDPGELLVFVFPGGAGSVQANVQRWQSQFVDASGQPPKVESKTVKGKNVDVTRVEVAGTFTDRLNNIGPKKEYRLLGAIVEMPAASYFLKLVGPEKTIAAAQKDFDALIASFEKTGK